MTEAPAISVVIPAFNEERWVRTAIESALGQEPAPLEVIVVDDGSTDGTAEVASGLGGRVRVLSQPNRGLAAARNDGAAAATGDAIFFLDADDELVQGALEEFVGAASRHPDWGVVTSNYSRVSDGRVDVAWPRAAAQRVLDRREMPGLIRRCWLQTNSLMRRGIHERFPFREGVAKDLDLWFRLLVAGVPVVVLGKPLVRITTTRRGSLSTDLPLMRSNRRRTFSLLWEEEDLRPLERAMTAYQLVRSTAGEAVARAAEHGEPRGEILERLGQDRNGLVRWTARLLTLPGALWSIQQLDRWRRRA